MAGKQINKIIMRLSGENFTGFTTSAKGDKTFQAFAPVKNTFLEDNFSIATETELEYVLTLSKKAFPVYSEMSYAKRAEFLDAIAEEIMQLGDVLLERCSEETGLPLARITGERGRTCGQLNLFANLLRDGWWLDARIDKAQPDRKPLPKPDVRRMLIPIGTVAVFGASNFPLAFSTAGGDTASALAAGCPVVVKAHSSHPGTNELVSSAIIKAAKRTGMPEGVFSSVYLSHEDVIKLVQHPVIKAVGFTGSRQVGMRLYNAATTRPEPIPVYAEMSAVNPVVLLENAIANKKAQIAKDLTGSMVLGAGQFCTNPGLILLVGSEASKQFLNEFSEQIKLATPATMLNRNICKAFNEGVKSLQQAAEVSILATTDKPASAERYEAQPVAHTVTAESFLSKKELAEEVFGPATLIVLCKNPDQLHQVLQSLEGQLTASVHADEGDEDLLKKLINTITQKAGRIVYGGYPTGVEVCHSMHHGGPFPSTTDAKFTSVGTAAINRFVRPVAYQDFPDQLLPDPLKNDNPLNILRLVDGKWTSDKV